MVADIIIIIGFSWLAIVQILKIIRLLFNLNNGIFKSSLLEAPTTKFSLIGYYLTAFAVLALAVLTRLNLIEMQDNF